MEVEVDDNVNDKNEKLKVILINSKLMDRKYNYREITLKESRINSKFSQYGYPFVM